MIFFPEIGIRILGIQTWDHPEKNIPFYDPGTCTEEAVGCQNYLCFL